MHRSEKRDEIWTPTSRLSTCRGPYISPWVVVLVIGDWTYYHHIAVLVFRSPLFYITMAPKCTSSDVGHLDIPKRSRKVPPWSGKVCVHGKKHGIDRVRYYPRFRASTGGLGKYPLRKRGHDCAFINKSLQIGALVWWSQSRNIIPFECRGTTTNHALVEKGLPDL